MVILKGERSKNDLGCNEISGYVFMVSLLKVHSHFLESPLWLYPDGEATTNEMGNVGLSIFPCPNPATTTLEKVNARLTRFGSRPCFRGVCILLRVAYSRIMEPLLSS